MKSALIIFFLFACSSAFADELVAEHEFKNGVYGSVLGDPGINFLGVNYAH